jgi:hypothetical protein
MEEIGEGVLSGWITLFGFAYKGGWFPGCSCCMEGIWGECGAACAMAEVENHDGPAEIGLEGAFIVEKIKEMRLIEGGLHEGSRMGASRREGRCLQAGRE